jgi:hypothetical protein
MAIHPIAEMPTRKIIGKSISRDSVEDLKPLQIVFNKIFPQAIEIKLI